VTGQGLEFEWDFEMDEQLVFEKATWLGNQLVQVLDG
jgi:hypothetical protein